VEDELMSARFQELIARARTGVKEVDVHKAKEMTQKNALLIDVREKEEWISGRASQAIHLSRGLLELGIEKVAPNIDTPVICYCGGGSRSLLAAENLQRMGYKEVFSMAGGFRAWLDAELPCEE